MMEANAANDPTNNRTSGDGSMNTIGIGSVGLALPVTSGIDSLVNTAISSGAVTGTISVPCSAVDAITHQQQGGLQAPPQHIQIPGTAMSIGSLAVAMGLSGANTDPGSLAFTSNALANLTARMGMSSMATSNPGGIVAAGNSLVTFPGNAALNIVPGMSMNPTGVSIMDGTGLSMAVAGGMAMQAPSNINVVGVQTTNDMANSNSIIGSQQQQQQGHSGGALLQNNVHINAGGSLLNSMGGGMSIRPSSGHSSGSCCGGCRTRVTVKDQSSQTDLSTVIQVKAEERLARSGLMPGARLISHNPGSTISHANPNSHHGPNFPCSCDFCGRMFAKKEYLRRHIRIHTGERPYKCVICGHSFRRSHHLRCHELTHTGTKPYACGICGKAFNLSHHLRRHEMTHTGEKPYGCTECGKAFTRKQHLDRHYKTHTGEYHRTFKCPFCEKMFFRAHHRDKHMKRHVLTTPDLTAATFSPVNNMNLSIRADGTLRADGLSSSPISVTSKDNSHSSEDYLTSDEEGKVPNPNKPKEGSKKRKGSSPMRLRFPYDYTSKDGADGMKLINMDMAAMKSMTFPIPHGGAGPSHTPGLPAQSNTILTTPTRGRPRGSKNRSGPGQGKKKSDKVNLMNQLSMVDLKSERMDLDRDGYGGVTAGKKDEDIIGGGVYGGKTIPNIPQQFVSESVVVRHPLQVGSPHALGQQQHQLGHTGDKSMSVKQDESTPGPIPTPTPTSTPDGRGQSLQWPPQQQQVGMNPSNAGGNAAEYMPGINRQLQTPGPAVNSAGANNGGAAPGDVQQTMHYKPPSTPDQNIHHAWPATTNWPRITIATEPGAEAYNQVDASRFMNIYNASKVMEMRMADLRGPQNFDAGQWNQGRRDQSQEKGDNRIYNMHH